MPVWRTDRNVCVPQYVGPGWLEHRLLSLRAQQGLVACWNAISGNKATVALKSEAHPA